MACPDGGCARGRGTPHRASASAGAGGIVPGGDECDRATARRPLSARTRPRPRARQVVSVPVPAGRDAGHGARRRIAMTLSVCCVTRDPGARVAAIMRQLRPVSTEIVVAVDSRLDPQRLGRYAEVADRLLRYEFVDSAEQVAPTI